MNPLGAFQLGGCWIRYPSDLPLWLLPCLGLATQEEGTACTSVGLGLAVCGWFAVFSTGLHLCLRSLSSADTVRLWWVCLCSFSSFSHSRKIMHACVCVCSHRSMCLHLRGSMITREPHFALSVFLTMICLVCPALWVSRSSCVLWSWLHNHNFRFAFAFMVGLN